MCIVYFVVGDNDHPTIICNNRDEYFVRPTQRGCLSMKESFGYSPKDLEGGGTWIAFDNIYSSSDNLKFAIVLNYHVFRDKVDYGKFDERKLKSRGKLVKEFLDGSTPAAEYAQDIFNTRYSYRPFNLIVSDGKSGAYYISWSKAQEEVIALEPGRLYGITNGYMLDEWEKVTRGMTKIEQILELKNFTIDRISDEIDEEHVGEIISLFDHNLALSNRTHDGFVYTHDPEIHKTYGETRSVVVVELLKALMEVMLDSEPLADPTFGTQSLPLQQLASIFVPPTIIKRSQQEINFDRYECLSRKEVVNDVEEQNVFGTRTITIFIHFASSYWDKNDSTATEHTEQKQQQNVVESISVSGQEDASTLSAEVEKKKRYTVDHSIFLIAENDITYSDVTLPEDRIHHVNIHTNLSLT